MAEQLIKVPDIGGAEGAEIVEVLVAPGDMIETEQSLVVVESDKASMEIPAPMSGVVGELRVAVGDTVSEGDVILALTTDAVAADIDAPNSEATTDSDTDADRQAQTSVGDAPLDSGQEDIQTAVANDTQAGSSEAEVAIDVTIPDLGSDEGADLVERLVEVGAAVAEGDSLVLLESDKASMEVPAPVSGTLIEWLMEPGTTVKEGMIIARLAAAHA
ncbi:MAG: biotin/lipoyl-binding protein, partial [Proteobacteria bacterium]|nr:biotin/lipoyl-binding protein [Pseudomonadota bacterium]